MATKKSIRWLIDSINCYQYHEFKTLVLFDIFAITKCEQTTMKKVTLLSVLYTLQHTEGYNTSQYTQWREIRRTRLIDLYFDLLL